MGRAHAQAVLSQVVRHCTSEKELPSQQVTDFNHSLTAAKMGNPDRPLFDPHYHKLREHRARKLLAPVRSA
jgi:hypothetical protein